jgi:hypothetical protein
METMLKSNSLLLLLTAARVDSGACIYDQIRSGSSLLDRITYSSCMPSFSTVHLAGADDRKFEDVEALNKWVRSGRVLPGVTNLDLFLCILLEVGVINKGHEGLQVS